MNNEKSKTNKEKQIYDNKERNQRIDNSKKKVEEGDLLFSKLGHSQEIDKSKEKILEKYRSAINEM